MFSIFALLLYFSALAPCTASQLTLSGASSIERQSTKRVAVFSASGDVGSERKLKASTQVSLIRREKRSRDIAVLSRVGDAAIDAQLASKNDTNARSETAEGVGGTAAQQEDAEASKHPDNATSEHHDDAASEVDQAVAASIGLTLVGTLAFLMTLFYGINFPDPEIAAATWKVLSEVSAAFCAVLLFSAFRDLLNHELGVPEAEGHEHGPPGPKVLIIAFGRLLLLAILVQVFLTRNRGDEKALHAWGLIGGVMVAFAAIDAFGNVQQLETFRSSPGAAFLVCLMAALSGGCRCLVSSLLRKSSMTRNEDGHMDKDDSLWDHECEHSENEGIGICIGLLLSSVIRFCITGHLPAIHGSPQHKSGKEINELTIVCFAMFLPVFGIAFLLSKVHKYHHSHHWSYRLVEEVSAIVTMTWGWCFVFLSRWIFWGSDYLQSVGLGNVMAARMTCALLGSFTGLMCIFIKDFIADRMRSSRLAFDSMIDAVVIGIAIGWEGAFQRAVKAVAELSGHTAHHTYISVGLSLFLCAITIPACVMYMIPMAIKGKKECKAAHKAWMALAASLEKQDEETSIKDEDTLDGSGSTQHKEAPTTGASSSTEPALPTTGSATEAPASTGIG